MINPNDDIQRPFQVIEGENKKLGAIHKKRMNIRCRQCNNIDRFYGTAHVHPFIIIERVADSKYDVTQIGYSNNGNIDEKVEKCANCNSYDIEVVVKVDFER